MERKICLAVIAAILALLAFGAKWTEPEEIEEISVVVEPIPVVEEKINQTVIPMVTRDVVIYEPPKKEEKPHNNSDIEIMARVVHAEAGNQDELGKRLIADTILNRVDSSSFPNTIKGVCTQDFQFAIWDSYTEDDMNAVLVELQERTDSEVVFFRTDHYHTFGIPMYQHGDHYFSKEDL